MMVKMATYLVMIAIQRFEAAESALDAYAFSANVSPSNTNAFFSS